MPLNKSELKQNISYAFTSQFLSMVVSVIIALIVPKLLGVDAFSYWQLFIFYTLYGGFLHLGLTDGVYLKIGGQKYEDLNYDSLGSQYKYSICIQIAICLLVCFLFCPKMSPDRSFVLISSSICVIIGNVFSFWSFLLQSVGLVKHYSISTILEKGIFIFFLILFFVINSRSYRLLIVLFIISRLFSLSYGSVKCKELILSNWLPFRVVKEEYFTNTIVGLSLTISNIASMTILGIGRFFIDAKMGIIAFGKVSFAILMVNFFVVFLTQISIVLFPALKRLSEKEISSYYAKLNSIFTILSPSVLFLYPFIFVLITYWLPQYRDSLVYFVILFPLVCYEGKMQMLNNTFLKVLREEKKLLIFNISASIMSTLLCAFSVFLMNNIKLAVMSMMVSIALRSLISELYLQRRCSVDGLKDIIIFNLLVVVFVISNLMGGAIIGFIIYTTFFILVYLYDRNQYNSLLKLTLHK
ncbi:MAG: hypothetical protein J5965_09745 [Aeriscardovia sp.]|nr:hypothetical protein [Aeriscardovia sp.]